jgi:hypothetical protein
MSILHRRLAGVACVNERLDNRPECLMPVTAKHLVIRLEIGLPRQCFLHLVQGQSPRSISDSGRMRNPPSKVINVDDRGCI